MVGNYDPADMMSRFKKEREDLSRRVVKQMRQARKYGHPLPGDPIPPTPADIHNSAHISVMAQKKSQQEQLEEEVQDLRAEVDELKAQLEEVFEMLAPHVVSPDDDSDIPF